MSTKRFFIKDTAGNIKYPVTQVSEVMGIDAYAKTADVESKIKEVDDKIADLGIDDYAKTAYVNTELAKKEDKVEGKGLSTNDYTDAEKALVATISNKANAADVYTTTAADSAIAAAVLVETNRAEAAEQDLQDAIDAIKVPTKVSELTNDSNFQTEDEVKAAIATAASEASDNVKEVADGLAALIGETEEDKLDEGVTIVSLLARIKQLESQLGNITFSPNDYEGDVPEGLTKPQDETEEEGE